MPEWIRTREKICIKIFPTSCCLAVLQMSEYTHRREVDINKSQFINMFT